MRFRRPGKEFDLVDASVLLTKQSAQLFYDQSVYISKKNFRENFFVIGEKLIVFSLHAAVL